MLLCSVACGLLGYPGGPSPRELVLAVEAAGLAAAAWLAELEQAAAGGALLVHDNPSLDYDLHALKTLYDRLLDLFDQVLQPDGESPDVSPVPGAVASLIGAAEASFRLAAALAQQLQPLDSPAAGGAAGAERVAQPASPGAAATCHALGQLTGQAMLCCAAYNVEFRSVACAAGDSAAVQGCAASLAKAAWVAAALPWEWHRAVWGTGAGEVCNALVTSFWALAALAAVASAGMTGAQQQR